VHLRVLLGDGVGDLFQDGRLAGLGRRDDHPPLALSDRRHQVEHARRQGVAIGLEVEALFREDRRQVFKLGTTLGFFGVHPVDRLDPQQTEVLLRVFGRADLTDNHVAGAQAEAADLRLGNVDVIGAGQIVIGPQESHPLAHDFEDTAAQLQAAPLGVGLHDAQDQILFLEPRRALDLEIAGDAAQIGQVHGFQLSDIHGFSRESGALGKASDSGRAARMTNEQVSRRQGLDERLNSPGDEPGTAVRYGGTF